MASDASTDACPWRYYSNQFQQKPSREWSQPLQQPWEPKIHFQLNRPKHSLQPPQRFTIPLRVAMDASPVIDRDFDSADLANKNVVAVLGNDFNPNSVSLFLQYICRRKRSLAANFPITEYFPKLWLWGQTYLLAKQFEVSGLQRLLARRIQKRLLEFEDVGVMCEEWWGVIELVKDADMEWEWLRGIMVDVKRIVAREGRREGICMEDELPEEGVEWDVFEAIWEFYPSEIENKGFDAK